MKTTYHRLIKILSCSLAIAAVLLCSVCVPAKAASSILNPVDYANGVWTTTEGTTRYSFRFKASPYYQAYNDGTLAHSSSGVLSWLPTQGYSYYRISVYPLGGIDYEGTMVDIRDFKTGAVLGVTFNAMFHLDISAEGSSSLTYSTRSQMILYWYDSDFTLLKSDNCGVVEKTGSWGASNDVWLLQNSFDMTIPEDASYVVPRYICQIYDPDAGDITKIVASEVPWLDVVVEKDDVNAESLLLESIERELGDLNDTADDINNQLGDLNDKADEMISGSDEMQDAADDFSDTADNAQQEMDSALDQLEELPEADPDDVDLTFDGLLKEKGFKQYSNFFMTLAEDSLWVSMMIIVCTFIWVSTLLYGKRG